MIDDLELLQAFRAGDRVAGDRLFRRHYPAVQRFFINKVSDEIDDLVHKTFLVCLEHPDVFQQRASFRAFLLGVAYKTLLRYIRDKKRRMLPFDPSADSIADVGSGVFTQFMRQREQTLLLDGLRRIAIDFQVVLELYYWERLSASECAVVLEIPEGTVRSRLRRGKEALLAALRTLPAASAEERQRTADNIDHWIQGVRAHLNPEPETAT